MGATQKGGLSIGARLALATVGVLAIVSIFLYWELTRRERQALIASKATAATMVADLFAASLGAPLDFADADAIQAELGHLRANSELSCAAVWSEGSDTPVAEARGGCDATAPIKEADLAGPAIREDRVEVARMVRARGKSVGKTRVVFSLARENAAFEASRNRIFWLSVLLATTTTILLLGIARRQIVLPLARLVDASGRIAKGDLRARVSIGSTDEIGQLGQAFNQMSEALADRDQRLAAATQRVRELFDHMRQAIFAFARDGRILGEVSKQAGAFFGKGLEGAKVQDLLYGGVPDHDVESQAFAEWCETAFSVSPSDFAELATLAPREVTVRRPDGSDLVLEVEFRPIEKDGRIDRVMLLATDVSEQRRLERTVEVQVAEHARRMTAMRRLVAGGAHLFVSFTERARERIGKCLAELGTMPREMSRTELDAVFRRAHTLKSEARAFNLLDLEGRLGETEDLLVPLRDEARGGGVAYTGDAHARLLNAIQQADDAVLDAREDFVAVSPVGRAALDQMTVQRSDVDELMTLVSGRGDAVADAVDRLAARRFGESTATLVEMTPAWAARENKNVHLDVDGRDVRVPPALARVLGGVLVHLVRNAIAHGVETPNERTRDGKEPLGTVKVAAKDGTAGPTVVVEDDGRGLDEAQILARARALGMDDAAPASELVFEPGLSTRKGSDALAGRGVGLDAVREELGEAGYAVRVESTAGKGTRYVLSPRD